MVFAPAVGAAPRLCRLAGGKIDQRDALETLFSLHIKNDFFARENWGFTPSFLSSYLFLFVFIELSYFVSI